MPSIRSQSISISGLFIEAADGATVSITRDQIRTYYQSLTGNAATRRAATKLWIRQQIVAALGGSVELAKLSIDFDNDDELKVLEVSS